MEPAQCIRCTEVSGRTTRLLLATRRHYSNHGVSSTLARIGRWLLRGEWSEPSDAVQRAGRGRATNYRWPTPPRVIDAQRGPRTVCFGRSQRGATHFTNAAELLEALRDSAVDVLILADVAWSEDVAQVCREAFAASVPVAYVGAPQSLERIVFAPPDGREPRWIDPNDDICARRNTMVACDVVLATDTTIGRAARTDHKPVLECPTGVDRDMGRVISDWYLKMRQPRVSLLTLSSEGKRIERSPELPYGQQSYGGEIELVYEIADATGDIVMLVPANSELEPDCVQAHVDAHAFGDCEVVVSSRRELLHEPLIYLPRDHEACLRALVQNGPIGTSCHGANTLSVKRAALLSSTSGVGEERSLHELRPKFVLQQATRRVTARSGWENTAAAAPHSRLDAKRLRVLTYHWHTSHQYELWKLPIDVTLVTGTGSPVSEGWDYSRRPFPSNAKFCRLDDVNPRDFDLAILHFDENVLTPENSGGVLRSDWGASFKLFREQIDLPKVAICHGTPQFHGQYDAGYSGNDLLQPIETERRRLIDYLANIHVVCNSHQAQAEWGFLRSSVIWHGFDPKEFGPASYESGIVSPLGSLVLSRPHYRGYFLYRKVFDGHYDQLRPEALKVPEPHPAYLGNAYALAKFRRYVDELRRYSIYFNPTIRSPMPRARGEPMMCGVVTVSARNHDVDRFIENGVDGFYADDPDELRSQLYFLLRSPRTVHRMGAASRAKAIDVFHIDRYLSDWSQLLARLV